LVLLFFLLRGPFRKYIVFSLYILAQCGTDIAVEAAYYLVGVKSGTYRTLYWTADVTQDVLLFLVVIAFTYAALRDNPLRPKAAKVLGLIVVVTLALPFAMLHTYQSKIYGFFTTRWFNHATQIWNFGAAIMNLVLWTALLSNRRRDPQLVTLSIGVGIATASAAIVWGARQWLPVDDRWPADMFNAAAQMGSLLLWCWVFRPKAAGRSRSATPSSKAPPPEALTTPS
jgi:hypothetical protein